MAAFLLASIFVWDCPSRNQAFERNNSTMNQLSTTSGSAMPKDTCMPKNSASAPSNGGPRRNTTQDRYASAVTFTAAGRSFRCATAEMASGKITAVSAPKREKPASAIAGFNAKPTSKTLMPSVITDHYMIFLGPYRSTKSSAKNQTMNWLNTTNANARPLSKDVVANSYRMNTGQSIPASSSNVANKISATSIRISLVGRAKATL